MTKKDLLTRFIPSLHCSLQSAVWILHGLFKHHVNYALQVAVQCVIKVHWQFTCPTLSLSTEYSLSMTIILHKYFYVLFLDTDCCTRQCCGPSRPFDMKILDNHQREVIHLTRPLRCSSCFFPCCLQEIEVQSPPGTVLGYCAQE